MTTASVTVTQMNVGDTSAAKRVEPWLIKTTAFDLDGYSCMRHAWRVVPSTFALFLSFLAKRFFILNYHLFRSKWGIAYQT